MNRATSIHGHRSTSNRFGSRLIWIGAYIAVVFVTSAWLYSYLFTAMAVVPIVSELLSVKLAGATGGYWKSLLWRIAGLIAGNLLLHYLYVLPVIYRGDKPWSEEILMRFFINGVQIIVAAFVLLVVILVRKKVSATPRTSGISTDQMS